jgi:tyrosyl-DNA phosphodiesterase 2
MGPMSQLRNVKWLNYAAYKETKASPQPIPVVKKPPTPQLLRPVVYHPKYSDWVVLEDSNGQSLMGGSVLKVVSWNINWSSAGIEARATAALEHLQELFGEIQDPFVVMFQEVCRESLQTILNNLWVQRNFVLSNTKAPESLYTNLHGDSVTLKRLDWRATPYFSLIMVSINLAIENCFRVPFVTEMGRDALVVDIPIFNARGQTEPEECLRLCTTHLESLWPGKAYRTGQLRLISALLKGFPVMKSRVVAGLVGGDMNSIDQPEHDFHRATDVGLQDAWEDVPALSIPVEKLCQKDLSYGRARGNTWGYQSGKPRPGKRLDKFLYTGSLETVAPNQAQDVTGRIGRLGIGLKTEVEVWEHETVEVRTEQGKIVEELHKEYLTEDIATIWRENGFPGHKGLVRTNISTWASDHFGITVGVKVLKEQSPTV